MEKIKVLKFALVAFVVALVSTLTVSCGSDDDDVSTFSLNVVLSGGGVSESVLETCNNQLRSQLAETSVTATESDANAWFDNWYGKCKNMLTPSMLYEDGFKSEVTVECQLLKDGSVTRSNKFTVTPSK